MIGIQSKQAMAKHNTERHDKLTFCVKKALNPRHLGTRLPRVHAPI